MRRTSALLSFSALAVFLQRLGDCIPRAVWALPPLPLLLACSGSSENPLIGSPGQDAGASDSAAGSDGGPRDPATCDLSRCGITVPAGFTLATKSEGSCPGGFTGRDLVSEPRAADGACTCACNVTQKPDCTKGSILRALDYTQSPACNTQATTLMATGNGCDQFAQPITTQGWHYAAGIAPSGGACTFDSKADDTKVTTKAVSICEAPADCPGAVCGSNVCVTKPGDVECPSTFPSKRVAGAKAKVECGACGACSVKAECDGTLSFFMDQSCATGKLDFPVNGTCNPNLYAYTYYSWSFQGSTKNTVCSATPPSTASAKLDQPTTVCCQK